MLLGTGAGIGSQAYSTATSIASGAAGVAAGAAGMASGAARMAYGHATGDEATKQSGKEAVWGKDA